MANGNEPREKPPAGRDDIPSDPDEADEPAPDERQEWIGQQLRKVYDETLNEPIPERFLDLLKQIDRKDTGPDE